MAGQQVNFGYSVKNIPISNQREYKQNLIVKTRKFLRNMNFRAKAFLGKLKPSEKEYYGFKTTKEPSRIPEMREFEDKMLDLVQNVEFHQNLHHKISFQQKLNNDIRNIKSDKNIYVKADKTTNFYKMSKERYDQLLSASIQKTYKKCSIEDSVNLIQK